MTSPSQSWASIANCMWTEYALKTMWCPPEQMLLTPPNSYIEEMYAQTRDGAGEM